MSETDTMDSNKNNSFQDNPALPFATPPLITTQYYRKLKRALIEREPANFDKINIIPCNGQQGWYEIAEHSALIYYYKICAKLNLTAQIHADTHSRYDKYNIGYIRCKGVNYVRDRLREAGLYHSEIVKDHVYIFKLNTSYFFDELKELEQKEKERQEKANHQLAAYNIDPDLHRLLASSGGRLHRITIPKKKDDPRLGTLTTTIQTLIDNLMLGYYRSTLIKDSKSKEYFDTITTMRADINKLLIYVQMLFDFRLWRGDTVSSVSRNLFQARDLIEQKLQKCLQAKTMIL